MSKTLLSKVLFISSIILLCYSVNLHHFDAVTPGAKSRLPSEPLATTIQDDKRNARLRTRPGERTEERPMSLLPSLIEGLSESEARRLWIGSSVGWRT